ncbi:MAG: glycosyltransferase family 2 protein [Alphaproteobacteria bacterium]|nr:glycosyltransferase family 2 protein [Alphaproteobacteria bacterium]
MKHRAFDISPMQAAPPSISVLMAAHNAAGTLAESVESILSQSFEDFEFIVVDDGSTDDTAAILARYARQDLRLRIVTQAENTGLTIALNRGLEQIRGRYIARQDADDASYPDRLQKQFDFLESRPDVALCGGNCDNLYPGGLETRWGWTPEETLQTSVFLKTPFPHSTAMMRATVALSLGGYDESFATAQDMEFWMRFAKNGSVAMLPDPLIRRRISPGAISVRRRWRQFYDAFRARWRHNTPGRRAAVLYHSLRSLLIGLLPERIIALKHNLKGNVGNDKM